jgi:molybdopterin-synthase adenylyltransferase
VTAHGAVESERYARQRLIPGWDQDRLAASTVVIVGVGALGNEIAKNMALAGVGRLVLCDPDVVSPSNLSRTVLFRAADVGKPKAAAAAAALLSLAPDVTTDPRERDLVSGVGLGELADADLVVSCVDTIRARLQLLSRCALVDAPLLDGGTSPWGAEIRVRVSADEPCFGCTLTPHQRSTSDTPWSCADPMADDVPQAAGIATTALAAGWMAAEAFGILLGRIPPHRILSMDVSAGRAMVVTAERDAGCPFHRPLTGRVVMSQVDQLATVGDFLATLGPDDEASTWHSFPVPPRLGSTKRARTSICLRDARPQITLRALGVAPQEMLPVVLPSGELTCHRLKATVLA